jgi:hypothetical protein
VQIGPVDAMAIFLAQFPVLRPHGLQLHRHRRRLHVEANPLVRGVRSMGGVRPQPGTCTHASSQDTSEMFSIALPTPTAWAGHVATLVCNAAAELATRGARSRGSLPS